MPQSGHHTWSTCKRKLFCVTDVANSDDYDNYDEDEINEEDLFDNIAREKSFEEFRNLGVYSFRFDVPKNIERLRLEAVFSNEDHGEATASTEAIVPQMSSETKGSGHHIHVRSVEMYYTV